MSTRYNTGNPIESTDVRDMSDNAKNFDEMVNSSDPTFNDRFGVERLTIDGFIKQYGINPASFDFQSGGTLISGDNNKGVLWSIPSGGDGQYYIWRGSYPKIIPASSSPSTTGGISDSGWLPSGDITLRSDLSAPGGSNIVGFEQAGAGAVPRTAQDKMRERITPMDFGAVGDGVVDDTAALTSLAAWVNSRPKYSNPVTVHFPNGTYLYSGGLDFIRPVAIYGLQGATLKYTGSGKALAVGDPTPENAPTADNFYQGEYTIDGLRFTGGKSATHGIFIKSFVFTPRIRNCLFVDFGNSASYDIYAQYEDWDGLIEGCAKHTYFSTTAIGNFIACVGKQQGALVYDGGNSRFTIRDCSMTAYDNQQMGYFAYLNSVKCRVIGGNCHHTSSGILLGPNAHGTLIDGFYAEVSTTERPWMVTVSSDNSNPANFQTPQGVQIKNCYVNMHSEVIGNAGKLIGMLDSNVLLRDWCVEDCQISTFADGQVLINMNNLAYQTRNTYKGISPVFAPYGNSGTSFTVVNNPPLSPSAWTSGDVEEGVWTPNVGGNATYLTQKGKFRREGRKVTVQFDLHINTIGTGNKSVILGLPYAVGSETGSGSVGYYVNLALNVYTLNIRAEALNANLLISGSTAPASGVSSYIAALGNSARIIGNCTYFI